MLTKLAKAVAIAVLAISAGATADAQSIKGIISVASQPEGLAVNYLTNRIYVALPSFGGTSDSLAIIDGKSDTVIDTISIPPIAYDVAVDVTTDAIYVGGSYTDENGVQQSEIVVVNGVTKKVERTIPISSTSGSGIQSIAVDPLTGKVYVANASDNVVDVIHRFGTKVHAQISVAESPFGVTVNPFNNQVYVALSNGTVDVINGRKETITTTTTVGGANAGIAANWVTGNVFVTNNNYGLSTVAVLDSKGDVLANVSVGDTPYGVDVDLNTNLAFVANTTGNGISVINGKTNTVTENLPVTGNFVAVNPTTSKVYITGQTNSVTVLNEQ
jgi:YVTN family beta-propeller protein